MRMPAPVAAATLSGMALGEAESVARDVLADVLAVFGTDPGLSA